MGERPATERDRSVCDSAGQALGATFGLGVVSLAVLHGAAVVLDLVLPTAGSRGSQAATAAVACLLLGALAVWHRVWGLPPRLVPHATGAAIAVAAASAAGHLVLSADPLQTMYLTLIVVSSGALLSSRAWLLAVEAIGLAALLVAGLPRADVPAWQQVAVVLLFSFAVAHLLQGMQHRAHRRLDQISAALAAQASRDDLTGLLNRRGLQQAVALLPDPAPPAHPAGTGTGALYLDVDGFKRINDELGHSAGDAVLVEVADRFGQLVRGGDLVGRVGGDEFVAVLPGIDAEQLAQLGHRVRIRLTGTAGVLQLPWAVSVGTALSPAASPPGGTDYAALLRAADLAMYADKQARRATDPPRQHHATAQQSGQRPPPGVVSVLPAG